MFPDHISHLKCKHLSPIYHMQMSDAPLSGVCLSLFLFAHTFHMHQTFCDEFSIFTSADLICELFVHAQRYIVGLLVEFVELIFGWDILQKCPESIQRGHYTKNVSTSNC